MYTMSQDQYRCVFHSRWFLLGISDRSLSPDFLRFFLFLALSSETRAVRQFELNWTSILIRSLCTCPLILSPSPLSSHLDPCVLTLPFLDLPCPLFTCVAPVYFHCPLCTYLSPSLLTLPPVYLPCPFVFLPFTLSLEFPV